MADLDNILSGQSDAVSGNEQEQEVTQVAEGEGQQQTEGTEQEGEGGGQTKMVPHEALHAEKQKVKRYTEEVADFRRSNEALTRQVTELLQRVPVPKVEQPQAPDWFADPDAALSERLGQAISPLSSTVSTLQTQIVRLVAAQKYGAEKVDAFEAYVNEAMAKGDPEMAALGAQMRASADPMKTGLDWFEKRTFDPEKERERIRAEILAETQGQQEAPQQRQAPVMPSNLAGARNVGARGGPAWSGPSSLQDIFNRTPASG